MATLVCTIETAPARFTELSPELQRELTRWMEQRALSPEAYRSARMSLEAQLAYSPLTASIAVLGLFDVTRDTKVVYHLPDAAHTLVTDDAPTFRVRTEAALLEDFWAGAPSYDTFISFNGRHFLLPFLLHRSAYHGIVPSLQLPHERTLSKQGPLRHIDLLDQLTFLGATRRHSLYHYCATYQLPLPATIEASASLLAAGRYKDAAQRTTETLEATAALYSFWQTYFGEPSTIAY